ncbi:MAG: UTP--glucose-1-phosphate uridylyltransferase [bacterium]|nr:UTP--glucose-1-phosphate uridylyltransferase [bacterium]
MTTRPDFQTITAEITKRMQSRKIAQPVIAEFARRVKLVHEGSSGKTDWNEIGDLTDEDYARLEDLPEVAAGSERDARLAQLVVIKLNGGLGTTMGLTKAKSLMPVKDGASFLEIIRRQIVRLREVSGATVPLFFMNSFNTREDTLAEPGIAELNQAADLPADFLQNMVPRIDRETLLPAGDGEDDAHWCPPGHGDIFLALQTTGLLDQLLAKGYRVAFLSNGDNLGATADERLLQYFLKEKLEFMSEVTPKTKADLKGGVLFRRRGRDGSPMTKEQAPIELLETAQVPEENLPDFQNIERFAYFNINNLWVNLEALRDRLRESESGLPLSLIVNPKELKGQPILQLETAMGAGIQHFQKAKVMIVPRTRFAPVKNCADLLVRRSDCYVLNGDTMSLEMNPERLLGEPVVTLSDDYKKIADFEKLMPTPPSLVKCASLKVEGPVLFDAPVTIEGDVTIRVKDAAAQSGPISIGGRTLKNETLEL